VLKKENGFQHQTFYTYNSMAAFGMHLPRGQKIISEVKVTRLQKPPHSRGC